MRPFTKIMVSGDWTDDAYNAFHTGDRWNGFVIPYFTFEEAQRVATTMGDIVYDAQKDVFVHADGDYDDTYQPVPITFDGKEVKTYPLGAGSWTWSELGEEVKIYEGFWSKDAFNEDKTNQVCEFFFCNDNGYTDDDIKEIGALNIGGKWASKDYGDFHTVTRTH